MVLFYIAVMWAVMCIVGVLPTSAGLMRKVVRAGKLFINTDENTSV